MRPIGLGWQDVSHSGVATGHGAFNLSSSSSVGMKKTPLMEALLYLSNAMCMVKQLYFAFKLIKISVMPAKRQIILVTEILSASPNNAMAVVTINTVGPTKANIVLM